MHGVSTVAPNSSPIRVEQEDFDTLGFTDYWIVDDQLMTMVSVNSLLAVYDHRAVNRSAKLGFWDPIETPNAPPSDCERLVVFGRIISNLEQLWAISRAFVTNITSLH